MNTGTNSNIDAIIRYALSVSSELEFPFNSLTTTTLIKVVYLADVAHAERKGETFTSTRWVFLHFGPWSPAVDERLEPATLQIGGNVRRFEGGVAFSIRRGAADGVEVTDRLPDHITSTVRNAIIKFRGEPDRLLHHVYRTGPMLRAAPEEELVFDETYHKGVAWLDSLGTPFPEIEGLAVVDETMWKSSARGLGDE